MAKSILNHAEKILERLCSWFSSNPVEDFYLVQLKRTTFGQYAPFPLVAFPREDIAKEMDGEKWQQLCGMLGHEIAHFCFGAVLESSPQVQWLSEGFAQYMSLLILEEFYGTYILKTKLYDYIESLQKVEQSEQAPLCNIPIDHPHQPMLVRRKGALVLHMLRQEIGKDGFLSLLKALINRYQGELITTETFNRFCEDKLDVIDVSGFFECYMMAIQPYGWDHVAEEVPFVKAVMFDLFETLISEFDIEYPGIEEAGKALCIDGDASKQIYRSFQIDRYTGKIGGFAAAIRRVVEILGEHVPPEKIRLLYQEHRQAFAEHLSNIDPRI